MNKLRTNEHEVLFLHNREIKLKTKSVYLNPTNVSQRMNYGPYPHILRIIISFVDPVRCSVDIQNQLRIYVGESRKQYKKDPNTPMPPMVLGIKTKRCAVELMFRNSIGDDGELSFEILPCIIEHRSREDPEITRQCKLPEEFSYTGEDPQECMRSFEEWIAGLGEFVGLVNRGSVSIIDDRYFCWIDEIHG